MDEQFWNDRYTEPGFTYGLEPNEFLASMVSQIPFGPILSLGEGEGRNAVFLAKLGYEVTAVDHSVVGLEKVRRLAEENSVSVKTILADLAEFNIETDTWSAIVSIFCHLPSLIRIPLHASVVSGLVRGGLYILESFTPKQIGRDTGGPPDPEMMVSLEQLRTELSPLGIVHGCELDRDVRTGTLRKGGRASVVQVIARKKQVDD